MKFVMLQCQKFRASRHVLETFRTFASTQVEGFPSWHFSILPPVQVVVKNFHQIPPHRNPIKKVSNQIFREYDRSPFSVFIVSQVGENCFVSRHMLSICELNFEAFKTENRFSRRKLSRSMVHSANGGHLILLAGLWSSTAPCRWSQKSLPAVSIFTP